jgi:acyl dehydratase
MPYEPTGRPSAGHSDPAPAAASSDPFGRPLKDRYFEDYRPGLIVEYGSYLATSEEIIDFARRFDPHDMHTDPELAKGTPLGELVASGWHTTAMMMRILVESYLNQAASVASPGVDELRWLLPVRPGDRLDARFTVLEARPSASRPDRGVVRTRIELLNQDGNAVMTQIMANLILRR